MTIREKMVQVMRRADSFEKWVDWDEAADLALSVLTNPDDETVERLAKVLEAGIVGDDMYGTIVRSLLEALKENPNDQ